MISREPLVKIQGLSKTYGGGIDPQGAPIQIRALKNVSFEIYPGEFVAVVGVNGSGKSTLIHCLGSFEQPDPSTDPQRSPIICRRNGRWIDVQSQVDWYRQNFVGIVFQAFHLLPKLSVWQNVEIPLKLGHCDRFTVDSQARKEAIGEVLQRLDMSRHFQSRINQTSGGERQRVAIARALVKEPSLLLADEPTGNLDEANKRNLVEIFSRLADEGVAVLMVTHDHRYVEDHAHRIITLQDGEIRSIETNRNRVASATATEAVQESVAVRVGVESAAIQFAAVTGPAEHTATAVVESPPVSNVAPAIPPAQSGENDNASAEVVETTGSNASPSEDTAQSPTENVHQQSTGFEPSPRRGKPAATLLNSLKRVRVPGCDQRFHDLASFALRDAWESSIALVSNVVAILCGTVLTALLMALLVGTDRFIEQTVPLIPNIDAVHAWVDYSTGAEPMTPEEFAKFSEWPEAVAAVPNIQQFTTLYKAPTRDTIVTLVSAIAQDPEMSRLKLLQGSTELDPHGWGIVINERVANDLDNFNPHGLVGKKITLQLRRYERADNPDAAKPSKVLDFPVTVVGIVANSYKDRVYGSLDMVRFVRDFATGRSEYTPAAEGPIDLSKISDRTMYEGVRVHFATPWEAEKTYQRTKSSKSNRFDLYWSGSEMEYLRDVQTVAFVVFLGIGLLTILAGSISVFNTLRAAVAHKSKEIGILRALGVTRGDIFFIYIFQSLIVGILAGISGLLFAWWSAGRLNAIVAGKWQQLAEALNATGGLFIIPTDVGLAIFGVVCLICVLAASLPALWAAQRTPMDSLTQAGQ